MAGDRIKTEQAGDDEKHQPRVIQHNGAVLVLAEGRLTLGACLESSMRQNQPGKKLQLIQQQRTASERTATTGPVKASQPRRRCAKPTALSPLPRLGWWLNDDVEHGFSARRGMPGEKSTSREWKWSDRPGGWPHQIDQSGSAVVLENKKCGQAEPGPELVPPATRAARGLTMASN